MSLHSLQPMFFVVVCTQNMEQDEASIKGISLTSLEPHDEKTCFMPYANNRAADQPAHPHSLISTFIVYYLDSKIPVLAM